MPNRAEESPSRAVGASRLTAAAAGLLAFFRLFLGDFFLCCFLHFFLGQGYSFFRRETQREHPATDRALNRTPRLKLVQEHQDPDHDESACPAVTNEFGPDIFR